MRMSALLLVAAALAVQPIGFASIASAQTQNLPDLGEESQSTMSLAQEAKIGEMVVRQIRAAGAYLDDPEVNDYLNEIGHRLVAAIPEGRQEFQFFAVGDSTYPAGSWIVLERVYPTRMKEGRLPTKAELDAAAPNQNAASPGPCSERAALRAARGGAHHGTLELPVSTPAHAANRGHRQQARLLRPDLHRQ